jgi:hypothetical protein
MHLLKLKCSSAMYLQELARLLQEQEMKRRGDSPIEKDRQIAVEAQDHEFAKMLHDKAGIIVSLLKLFFFLNL